MQADDYKKEPWGSTHLMWGRKKSKIRGLSSTIVEDPDTLGSETFYWNRIRRDPKIRIRSLKKK